MPEHSSISEGASMLRMAAMCCRRENLSLVLQLVMLVRKEPSLSACLELMVEVA